MSSETNLYGKADNSYKAAGELPGIIKLVDAFYDFMEEIPEAKKIRNMHPDDLSETRKKLAYFLSGWLGGPKLYPEHFGKISLPKAHQHLSIGVEERDAWILCMQKAVNIQAYEDSFKTYLIEQLRVPAERIRVVGST
jgi:hemoglobin